MTSETTHRGGFIGFLTTIPGIITAFAGLITALVGLAQIGLSADHDPVGEQPTTVDTAPETVPDQTVSADEIQLSSAPQIATSDPVEQMINGCAAGDLAACTSLLDALTAECFDGTMPSCDFLYQVSPIGSDYEAYGATCGGRFGAEFAGTCGQL